jgi:hypothetical protein
LTFNYPPGPKICLHIYFSTCNSTPLLVKNRKSFVQEEMP